MLELAEGNGLKKVDCGTDLLQIGRVFILWTPFCIGKEIAVFAFLMEHLGIMS